MQVTQFGHSCVLLDTGTARLDDLVPDIGPELPRRPAVDDQPRVRVEVLGGQHAIIHPDIPRIVNNGYLIDGTHFHPGDALDTVPSGELEVLFLPTAAPWQKLADAVTYLREVAPRTAVPIHQGILAVPGMYYGHFERLGPEKTALKVLDPATPTTV